MNPYDAPQTIQPAPTHRIGTPQLSPELFPVIQGARICFNALLLVVSLFVGGFFMGFMFYGLLSPMLGIVLLTGLIVAALMHLLGLGRMRFAPQGSGAGELLTISMLCFAISLALSIFVQVSILSNSATALIGWLQLGNLGLSTVSCVTLLLGLNRLGDSINVQGIRFWTKSALVCWAYIFVVLAFYVTELLSPSFQEWLVHTVNESALGTISFS